jgi:hypothetical protein
MSPNSCATRASLLADSSKIRASSVATRALPRVSLLFMHAEYE